MSLKISLTPTTLTNTSQSTRLSSHLSKLGEAFNSSSPSEEQKSEDTVKSTYLYLSEDGLEMSRKENKNQDIDDSNLPSEIKDLMKLIRELKEQVQLLTKELEKVMADKSLSEEQRDAKTNILQTEIGFVNGALLTAMSDLVVIIRKAELEPEQLETVATLLMK